jgi:hypothetical protein
MQSNKIQHGYFASIKIFQFRYLRSLKTVLVQAQPHFLTLVHPATFPARAVVESPEDPSKSRPQSRENRRCNPRTVFPLCGCRASVALKLRFAEELSRRRRQRFRHRPLNNRCDRSRNYVLFDFVPHPRCGGNAYRIELDSRCRDRYVSSAPHR